MKSLKDKVIFITGAAGGLGREYARQFLKLGARLILTDVNEEALNSGAKEIENAAAGASGKIIGTFAGDISTAEGCHYVHRKCEEISKDVNILLNNAGIINYGYYHEIPEDKMELLMNVNLLAPMRLTHLFLPRMVACRDGHVVFMCSVAGYIPTSFGTPYSASKFGIRGFGMGLCGELKKLGIAVTNIYPSWVNTALLKSPEYGNASGVGKLPSVLAEKPENVIAQAIKGIRKQKLHVYPSHFSRTVWYGTKFWPIISKQAH